jgi:RimJ/RimL family protein N-acetyltransferase
MKLVVPPHMKLRSVDVDDHEWLVGLHNDPVVLRNMTHPQSITIAHHLAWWEKISHDDRQLRLVFEVDGARAGFAKFYDIDHVNRNCVLGGDVHKDHRGLGYAKHMWTLMLQLCFDTMDLHRVGLTTAEYNVIGRQVYHNLGFREEGRLAQSLYRDGKFHDTLCCSMLKDAWNNR